MNLSEDEKARRKLARVRRNFFSKVEKTPACWLWIGHKIRRGYGQLRAFNRQRWQAHRLSWLLHYGEIPDGKWVLHRCDNPSCVNPHHLFLGTHDDNVADKVSKNRQMRGTKCHTHKLTERDVARIRSLLQSKVSYQKIATQFKVTKSNIYAIKHQQTWKHVPQ
jgi:hypothetical protein